MVTLQLKKDLFINRRYVFKYGNREALFTIVDEELPGMNRLGRINLITIITKQTLPSGAAGPTTLRSSVVGLGDNVVGVTSIYSELRGQRLSQDNMERCTVLLYEDTD